MYFKKCLFQKKAFNNFEGMKGLQMQSESRLKLILHKILSKQGSALKSGGLE
jgi:hypothetical protein